MIHRRVEPSLIEEIRQRLDIVDTISQYVPLKRSGQNYKGICPFHQEKTPSFTVHTGKQIFYCFGCGQGGNVFSFLMTYHGQTFMEVLRDMASQVGVSLVFSETVSEKERLRDLLKQINHEALAFYRWLLSHPVHGEEARAYLKTRNMNLDMQERFHLGYALNSWSALYQHLQKKGFSEEEMDGAGLFGKYEKKPGRYDLFRHRIIFPIMGTYDDVLAFGGRTLMDHQAKYINSPETALYQKGKHLYGLNVAKGAIRQRDQVVVVEGYLDTITAHQYGFEQTVATLGTALTSYQAKQIIRFTAGKQVVIAYDADRAGQQAADRGIEVLETIATGVGVRIRIACMPDQKDPDTFLHEYGEESFRALLNQAQPFVEYQLSKIISEHDMKQATEKAMAVDRCLPILMRVSDPIYRDECIRLITDKTQIREEALRTKIRQVAPQGVKKKRPVTPQNLFQSCDKIYRSEIGLLYLMVEYSEQREKMAHELLQLVFEDRMNEILRLSLLELYAKKEMIEWSSLFDHFQEPTIHQRLAEIMENGFLKEIDWKKSLADFIRNVKLKCLDVQIKEIGGQIKQAEAVDDTPLYASLMQTYSSLMQTYTHVKEKKEWIQINT